MFQKILYPTDFSEASKKTLDYIKKLRECGSSEVILLHVIDDRTDEAVRRYADEAMFEEIKARNKKESESFMAEMREELKAEGFAVRTIITRGIPFREILKVEEEEDVSVVVVGSHGMSNIAEMLLGSVSDKVLRKSKRAVLVVKR